ncbi:MAG: hypothetical protein OXT67_12010 [Zetaproteobacteria bacterium]|nr:hypothetical protein [Zetaproteobacteria bacterium]
MKYEELFANRQRLLLTQAPTTKAIFIAMVAVGVVGFLFGVLSPGSGKRAWASLLLNAMFFYSLALGGVAFGNMQDVVGALWGRPIKRIHESFGCFLPWMSLVLAAFILAVRFDLADAGKVYSWVADPHILDHFHGKDVWLQVDFMLVRDLLCLAVTYGLVRWHLGMTHTRDQLFMEGKQEQAQKYGEEVRQKLRHWSAPVMVVYSLCFSVICFDLTMSLAPTWFSTLWAGWSFAIMMHILMASTLLFLFFFKNRDMGQYIKRQQFHDIGKLLFGFTVFFAYLTYAHVLTYWYGNVPEETSYFHLRLEQPWKTMIMFSPLWWFFVPFISLIWKSSKWTTWVAIPVSVVVLCAQWFNYVLVVIPEVVPGTEWNGPWVELPIFVGCLGGFLWSLSSIWGKVPLLSVADPLLLQYYDEAH